MSNWAPKKSTGALLLKDGKVFRGFGCGYEGNAIGEVCFNTAMTGYQEIMTDPSYASQIITFTFPHIGNVGVNSQDTESEQESFISGAIFSNPITSPSNWRSEQNLNDWLIKNKIVGLYGIDTRELTSHIRKNGFINGVIINDQKGESDKDSLLKELNDWEGIEGQDLAAKVSTNHMYTWKEKEIENLSNNSKQINKHIVVIDYGVKSNILRCLSSRFNKVTIISCNTSASDIISLKPDGIFLSNGPGDPLATGKYAIPIIKELMSKNVPIFGICLGHQIISLALGAKTKKMFQGHRGANQPVKNLINQTVEITSQNHGFEVERSSLPNQVTETHISLFDGSNEGIKHKSHPIFSVQYHPESSPGPHDSRNLFARFASLMSQTKSG